MHLEGQAGQRGYALAALLVAVSMTAIMMMALLPAWRHQAQREKEAELAFRGEQYARAIYLFRRKNNNQPPPNVDVLVSGKYLRKKYKDPITGEDFTPIYGGQQPQQQPGPQGRGGAGPSGRAGTPTPTTVGSGLSGGGARGAGGTGVPGGGRPGAVGTTGLATVQSKSKLASIRIYYNAAHYNEWLFRYNVRGVGGMAGEGAPGTPGVRPGQGGRAGGGGPRGRGLGPGMPPPPGGRAPGRGFSRGGGVD